MLFRLIATFVLVLAVAGIVIFLNKFVLRGRLPKWVLPASIAATILGYFIFDEYNWYARKHAGLMAENFVVLETSSKAQLWRPWSQIKAPITGVLAINPANRQDFDNGRWSGFVISSNITGTVTYRPIAIDCEAGRIGDFYGEIDEVVWEKLPEDWSEKLCQS